MHWKVVSTFINKESDWLTPFVPGKKHSFSIVSRDSDDGDWHKRKSEVSSLQEWVLYWKQSWAALKEVSDSNTGIITVFPQLAFTLGLQTRLMRKNTPIVAHVFNIGTCYPGLKGMLARFALKNVTRFVVHTHVEIDMYSEWLNIPKDRFVFAFFQKDEMELEPKENNEKPFIVAMGSARRDYATLINAVKENGIRTMIIAAPRALEGIEILDNVEVVSGISMQECLELSNQARINIIPLQKIGSTGSGQVTIVTTMMLGKALIVSNCNGASDYIENGETGLLVEPGSVEEMRHAINKLWNDDDLRNKINKQAGTYAKRHFTDEVAGKKLGQILDEVENEFYS